MYRITALFAFALSVSVSVSAQDFEPCTDEGVQICRVGGYQICAHHDNSGLTFGPVLSCGPETTCFPNGRGILCRPITDLLECPFGGRRCFNSTSFQECTSFSRGTVWGFPQACETDQVCQQGTCFASSDVPPLPPCEPGHMQCVTATTFQTCLRTDTGGAFGEAQPCAPGTECKPFLGNFITCGRPGLV